MEVGLLVGHSDDDELRTSMLIAGVVESETGEGDTSRGELGITHCKCDVLLSM